MPTRVTRCTKARSQPCVTAKLPELDSNQHLHGPEPCVLPVRRSGIECGRCESNAQATSFEFARSAKLPSLPRTPPRIRTEIAQGKSLVLWPVKLATLGADDRNRTCVTWVEAMRLCHSATPARWLPQVATLPLLLFRQPLIRLS